jgi:uncharacterized protein (DUF924 family)
VNYDDVLSFWFECIEKSKWWVKDIDFDLHVKEKFLMLHGKANRCELFEWRECARGRLAEIIVLDQFSRNIFRDKPNAFSSDGLALALAQEAISLGKHNELSQIERSFLFMPYMHSESLVIHDIAIGLYGNNGVQSNLEFEVKHRNIIEEFGRYPHRNIILNRESTNKEIEFLKQPDSGF